MNDMKITSNLFIMYISTFFLFTGCGNTSKEEDNIQKAQNILKYIVEGEMDSLQMHVNDNILNQMPPVLFIQSFQQLEEQFGRMYPLSEWEEFSSSGSTIYFKDIAFGEYDFRLTIAFDPDGKANTIYLNPVTEDGLLAMPEE